MTPLEALEDLFNLVCEREHTNSEHNFWLKLYNKIEKSLKALEIIKYNRIDNNEFEDSCDADDYNQRYNSPIWHITQEEYDLLKEVLDDTR